MKISTWIKRQAIDVRTGGAGVLQRKARVLQRKVPFFGARSLALFNKPLALRILERRGSIPVAWLISDKTAVLLVVFIMSSVKVNDCTPREAEEATNLHLRLDRALTMMLDRNSESQQVLELVSRNSLHLGKVSEWAQYVRRLHLASCGPGGSSFQDVDTEYLINLRSVANLGFTCHWDRLIKARLLNMVPEATFVLGYNSNYSAFGNSHLVTRYFSDFVELREPRELGTRGAYLPEAIVLDDVIFPNNHGGLAFVQQRWESSGHGPLFDLKPDDEEFGRAELVRLGMPKDAWFTTVHARTAVFKNVEQFRDSDISTFMDAARLIIDAGGWVVRIGSANEPPMPQIEGLIDYARSPRKSARMDIFLMAGASLFVGLAGSGPATVAEAFGVPLVLTNYLPTATLYQSRQTLFIPRLLQYADGRGFAPFDVSFREPLCLGACDLTYLQNGVVPVPNTSKEISDVVKQALHENGLTAPKKARGATWDSRQILANQAAQERQKEFKELCLRNNVLLLPHEVEPLAPLARIGDSFLKQHHALLN